MKSIELDDKRSEEETVEAEEKERPKWPYGTCITINHELLDILDIKELPEVGAKFKIEAECHVAGVSQYENKDMSERQFTLQIEEMDLSKTKEDYFKKVAKKVYGSK
jgi:hypothetical protein